MANKLYPPQIETSIPAMYTEGGSENIVLSIPFQLNRAVSLTDINAVVAKISTLSTGQVKKENIVAVEYSEKMAKFVFNSIDFNPGQYYKVQIAFKSSDGTIGYYSAMGIVKYLLLPNVTMSLNASPVMENNFLFEWNGIY
jgi:hypothetical protein